MLLPALSFPALFASRVFLPLFAVALAVRFGPDLPLLSTLGVLAGLPSQGTPAWLTSNLSLVVLGSLSAVELLAHKGTTARELLNEIDPYVKPVAAAIGLAGLLAAGGGVAPAAEAMGLPTGWMPVQAGIGSAGLAALAIGGVAAATFLLAIARRAVLSDAANLDSDDDTGLFGLFSWGEDLWAVFGVFLFVLWPALVVVLVAVGSGFVLLLYARSKRREAAGRVACDACEQEVSRSALRCPHCGVERPVVQAVGLLGGPKVEPVQDRKAHAADLRAVHRCPSCAHPLKDRHPLQDCRLCGRPAFATAADAAELDRRIAARLPWVLAACAGFSAIPVVGLVPGVILYRLTLVAPYRRYLPRGRSLLTRWGVRLGYLFLIFVQLWPGAGALAVPAMALLAWSAYRGAFRALAAESLDASPGPLPAAAQPA